MTRHPFANNDVFLDLRPHLAQISSVPLMQEAHWQFLKKEISPIDHDHSNYYAGRPVSDMCIAGAETGAPVNATANISVWDMAVSEASNNALDLATLELMQNPDGFATLAEGQKLASTTEDEEQDASTWQQLLKQYLEKTGREHNAKDFLAYARAVDGVTDADIRIITGLANLTGALKPECQRLGLKSRELFASRTGTFTIFSCQNDKKPVGPAIDVVSLKSLATDLVFSWFEGDFSVGLHLEEGTVWPLFLTVTRHQKPIGSQYWFNPRGQTRGVWQHGTGVRDNYGWNDQGQLVWHGRINSSNQWQADSSWYPSGKVQSQFIFDSHGQLQTYLEYFANGMLAETIPFQTEKVDGIRKWSHENGKPAGEIAMTSGKRFGKGMMWFDTGSIGYSSTYADDTLDREIQWRTPHDTPLLSAKFHDGNAEGMLLVYDDDGHVLAKGGFDHGRAEGSVEILSGSNKAHGTIPFKSGVLDGVVHLNDIAGVLRAEIPYRSGRINGDVVLFSNSAKRLASCHIEENRLASWSYTPDKSTAIRFNGKVIRDKGGAATQTMDDGGTGLSAECESSSWQWQTCHWRERGVSWPKLSVKSIADFAETHIQDKMFQPKRCGGANLSWDFSPWLYESKREVKAILNVKGECKNPDLFTSITCRISFAQSSPKPMDCQAVDDGEGDGDGDGDSDEE